MVNYENVYIVFIYRDYMAENRPSREDDSKIVMSKLPRDEFANFKKVCEKEEKTPNKKIRELIKLEVDEKLGDIYKLRYDQEKINLFQIRTLEDYNNNLRVEKICNVRLVNKTDKDFIQIGWRPLIDEDIFLPDANVSPYLPGLGMEVAIGEENMLIMNLLDNKKIERTKMGNEKLLDFPSYAFEFNNANILISLKFFIRICKDLMHRIEYTNNGIVLDSRYNLIFIPEKTLDNKIIILDKDAVLWEKEIFPNEFTDKDETLDIKIAQRTDWKVDITVRSVNKIKYMDPELIKILEVENEQKR